MIYTVTFNPSLDYSVKINELAMGHTNRSLSESLTVGGKGINVSLVLSQLGVGSIAVGFTGGFVGDCLENMLSGNLVKCRFVRVSGGNTRINVKLLENQMTEINAGGPVVSEEEVQKLLDILRELSKGDTVVISGSVPRGISGNVYERILEITAPMGVRAVVDATGELLLRTLKYRPFLVKPNIDELGELFATKIKDVDDAVKYAKELKKLGAVNVIVSMGENGAILVDENENVINRKAVGTGAVNPVGAGDSMIAGFLAGIDKGSAAALDLAIAAGGATACSEGLATKEKIDKFLEMINRKEYT